VQQPTADASHLRFDKGVNCSGKAGVDYSKGLLPDQQFGKEGDLAGKDKDQPGRAQLPQIVAAAKQVIRFAG